MEVSHSQFSVNVLLRGAPQDRQIKHKEETVPEEQREESWQAFQQH